MTHPPGVLNAEIDIADCGQRNSGRGSGLRHGERFIARGTGKRSGQVLPPLFEAAGPVASESEVDEMTTPFSFKQVFGSFQHWLQPRPKSKATPTEIIQTGDFRIDLRSREVTVRGKEVELTQEELDLLLFLTTHPKKVITRSTRLLTKVRGNGVRQTQFLRVLLQLCRKIEPDASSHHYIQTEPWVFYRFDPGRQF